MSAGAGAKNWKTPNFEISTSEATVNIHGEVVDTNCTDVLDMLTALVDRELRAQHTSCGTDRWV